MFKKALCLLILMTGFVASVCASTVKWLIAPKYDAISYFSETLFKCKIDGKSQLVDLKGQTLLPRAADSITDFSEGIALVLEKTNKHYKVVGFVKESDHSYLSINGNYYAGMYSFFSEGLIALADANTDLFGYLNDKGEMLPQEALHFNYPKARPFIKGWASVEQANKNQTTIYINKQGKTMNLNAFHRGKVVLGSSFNASGEALITYYGDDNAIIDTKGNIIRKYKRLEGTTPVRICDFAFDENGRGCVAKPIPPLNEKMSNFSENGVFGYVEDEKTMVPAQFTYAGPFFANGCAIAAIDNKYGVLSLVEGDFKTALDLDKKVKNNKGYVFTLHIPPAIAQQAEIKFDNGDGILRPISLQDSTYKFSKKEKEFTIRAQITIDDLLLWDETIIRKPEELPFIIIGPSCDDTRANNNNLVKVKTIVKNNTENDVTVTCSFTANFDESTKNSFDKNSDLNPSTIIAAKKSEEFSVDIFVKKSEKVTVSVSIKIDGKQYKRQKEFEIRPVYSFQLNH